LFIKSGKTDLSIVEEEFHAKSPIRPEVGQRIVLLGMDELIKKQTTNKDSQIALACLSDLTILLLAFVALCVFEYWLAYERL